MRKATRWAMIVATVGVWVAMSAPAAWAAGPDACWSQALAEAEVSVRLDVRARGFDQWVATSTTTVQLPSDWPLAEQLLRDDHDDGYLAAMRCLFGPVDADPGHRPPKVVVNDERMTITDVVRITVNEESIRSGVGFWKIDLAQRQWELSLRPEVLTTARWSSVTVASAVPVEQTTPPPRYKDAAGTLTWIEFPHEPPGAPAVSVRLRPPAPVALAGWLDADWHWTLRNAAYGVADLLVYVFALGALLKLRRQPGSDSGVKAAVNWVLRGVWLLAAVHGLVVLGSVSTELVWGFAGGRFGEEVAVGEWAAWTALLLATALLVWLPQPRPRPRNLGIAAAVILAGVVALAVRLARGGVDEQWRPTVAEPLRVDVVPVAVGIVSGLLLVAAYAGAVAGVWRVAGWGTPRAVRRAGVVLAAIGLVLAAVSPLQYAAHLQGQDQTTRWLSEAQWLWAQALAYPRWLSDMAGGLLWVFIALAILAVHYQRARHSPELTGDDRRLAIFLFVLVAVWWPDGYAGLFAPVGALVSLGTLHLVLRRARPATVSSNANGLARDGRLLAEQARRYSQLEARGRRLDAQWAAGEAGLTSERYQRKRAALRRQMRQCRTAMGLQNGVEATPVDAHLVHGPNDDVWSNAYTAARLALIPAGIATAYMLAITWRDGGWHTTLDGWFGPIQLLLFDTANEFLFWIGAAFVLGLLWRELPGTRGYIKPWPLIVAYGAGVAANHLLVWLLGQTQPQGQLTRIALMSVFLAVVAVLIDLRTLNAIRDAWTPRLSPLMAAYRVGPASTTLPFLLAQAVAALGLWHQLRGGGGVSGPPSPPGGRAPSP